MEVYFLTRIQSKFDAWCWILPMDGISLIGLPLLELEELDVLGLVELATEDEDLFCDDDTEPPRIWWDGGGGAGN